MAIEYLGINYFPLLTGFFHCDKIELLTAMFGIKGPYAAVTLLCKIYTDGYYIPWGKEQCMIFARKLGPEYDVETMEEIVDMLIKKDFFDKESYEKYGILTSADIQRVWMEATSRRKRDLTALTYLLVECTSGKNGYSKEGLTLENVDSMQAETKLNSENVDIVQTKTKLNSENVDISRQSKVNKSKVKQSKELPPSIPPGETERNEDFFSLLPLPPKHALNERTHNYYGLLENIKLHRVKEPGEINAILKLSDYGRKGTVIWKLFAQTHWSRIEAPGKYIIKVLRGNS